MARQVTSQPGRIVCDDKTLNIMESLMTTRKADKTQASWVDDEKIIIPEAAKIINPFDDLDALSGSQDFIDLAGVKKALVTVPIRKPGKSIFVRVHSDPAYSKDFWTLEYGDDRDLYLVLPHFAQEIEEGLLSRRTFFTAITRQGVLFLWAIKLPTEASRKTEWPVSERTAALQAMKAWTRVSSNMQLGAYEHSVASGKIDDPIWPDHSFGEILKIAFKGKEAIGSHDHEVMKLLRGE